MLIEALYLPSTPLNIFLSLGIAIQRGVEFGETSCIVLIDQPNTLISDNIYCQLLNQWENSPFVKCLFLPNDHGVVGKIRTRRRNFNKLNKLIAENDFKHVFVGNDRRVEFQYCIYQIKKSNAKIAGYYLDDGLYTYVAGMVPWGTKATFFEEGLKSFLYPWFVPVDQVGCSRLIQTAYVAFPHLVLEEIREKECINIQSQWFTNQQSQEISRLACDEFDCDREKLSKIGVLFNLCHPHDMRGVINYKEKLTKRIQSHLDTGIKVGVKYHPRTEGNDNLNLQSIGDVYLLPKGLALEFILPLLSTDCLLIGDRSTVLVTSMMLRPDIAHLALLDKASLNKSLLNLMNKLKVSFEYW
jgi:hypothetical protein